MARKETMTTSTNRYLREAREWLTAWHPLAVALKRTAEALDLSYTAAVMSQYSKLLDQAEKMRPAQGQAALPGTQPGTPTGAHLIGPRVA